MGSCARSQLRPRLVETATWPSLPTIMRLPSVGSIHMSWLSPPGDWPNGRPAVGGPPSSVLGNEPHKKDASVVPFRASPTRRQDGCPHETLPADEADPPM